MQKHWIWLTQRQGIGHVGCKKLLTAFGSAEELYDMTAEQYLSSGQKEIRRNWIDTLSDKDLSDAEKIVEACEHHGIQIITYNDPTYPQRLKDIYDPPCVLYCKGTLPEIDREAVIGVVGTRRCTGYGLLQAKQLSSLIALSGGIVVSGGARGIDYMALLGAMPSYNPVICVLAGGLDEYYPREHRKLFEDITRQGCLLSEHPPGVKPHPSFFVARNRIVSGLSVGVLVVEAPKGSGAMITAELALSQNRDVFTVARADSSCRNQGNTELINAGCEVVRDGWELLSGYVHLFPDKLRDGRGREAVQIQCKKQFEKRLALSSPDANSQEPMEALAESGSEEVVKTAPMSVKPTQKKPVKKHTSSPTQGDLPETESAVLAVLGKDPMEIDEIIVRSGMAATAVSTALTMLQLKKRIIKCFGNSYQRI